MDSSKPTDPRTNQNLADLFKQPLLSLVIKKLEQVENKNFFNNQKIVLIPESYDENLKLTEEEGETIERVSRGTRMVNEIKKSKEYSKYQEQGMKNFRLPTEYENVVYIANKQNEGMDIFFAGYPIFQRHLYSIILESQNIEGATEIEGAQKRFDFFAKYVMNMYKLMLDLAVERDTDRQYIHLQTIMTHLKNEEIRKTTTIEIAKSLLALSLSMQKEDWIKEARAEIEKESIAQHGFNFFKNSDETAIKHYYILKQVDLFQQKYQLIPEILTSIEYKAHKHFAQIIQSKEFLGEMTLGAYGPSKDKQNVSTAELQNTEIICVSCDLQCLQSVCESFIKAGVAVQNICIALTTNLANYKEPNTEKEKNSLSNISNIKFAKALNNTIITDQFCDKLSDFIKDSKVENHKITLNTSNIAEKKDNKKDEEEIKSDGISDPKINNVSTQNTEQTSKINTEVSPPIAKQDIIKNESEKNTKANAPSFS